MKNNIALIILLIAFLSVACNEQQSNNRQLTLDFPFGKLLHIILFGIKHDEGTICETIINRRFIFFDRNILYLFYRRQVIFKNGSNDLLQA